MPNLDPMGVVFALMVLAGLLWWVLDMVDTWPRAIVASVGMVCVTALVVTR